MTSFSKSSRARRRRLALGTLAAMLFASFAVVAGAAHWPFFGGDAGRSGHQPVDPTGPPIVKAYAKLDDEPIVTSVITTAGGDATVRRMVYGTEGAAAGADGNVHLQTLSDGDSVGPEAGVDVEDGANDADTFRGQATGSATTSGLNPQPAGSVTPVDSSTAAGLGQVFAVHNDDNQDGGAVNPVTGDPDPRTGNDIAIAIIDEESGNASVDKSVGGNVNNTTDAGYDPTLPNTVNYTISSSPLLTPPAADGSRDLYFVAERASASADETFPCVPDTSFEDEPPAGPFTRGCEVSERQTLFKVHISDAGTEDANFAPEDISWVDVANANPLASPSLVYLDGAEHIAVSVNSGSNTAETNGGVHFYKAADIGADPATPAPAYTVLGLGTQVMTPSAAVTSSGAVPNPTPAIWVAGNNVRSTTNTPQSQVHRITRDPEDATKLKAVQSSPNVSGEAAPALAVSAVAAANGSGFSGGRVLYTTGTNLYSLQPDDLTRGTPFDIGSALARGTTGFSRTTAAVSGDVAFVQRDNGEHLARNQYTLDAVAFDAYGPPDNDPTANDGIGQASISARFVQFGNADGAFVYRASPFVPTPGSITIAAGDVTVREGDSGTSVATFTLTKTGGSAAAVTVQTADGTATAGQDYVAAGPTVVEFGPEESTKTFSVTINGDTAGESDEFFKLQLSAPSTGVIITDSEGAGIIQNDDPVGTGAVLIVSDQVVTEGDARDVAAVFTVTLTSPSTRTVTVAYGTANRTATGGRDFTPVSGTLTFAPGEQAKTFTVPVRPDTRREPTEQFLVGITNAVGATVADPIGVGTIVDDDGAPLARLAQAPRITLAVTPRRDRARPFRFTSTGRLRIPSGLARAKGCQGRVEIQVKAVRKTISTRRRDVGRNCRFRLPVTFRNAQRFSKSGVLSFRARYLGSVWLKRAKSREVKVRTVR